VNIQDMSPFGNEPQVNYDMCFIISLMVVLISVAVYFSFILV
jgi:hypothetical protein